MKCSVVICTVDREASLRRLLAALGHLRGAEFEVVVVNGPSADGTAALLGQYQGLLKVVDCPARNISQSRNLGIAAAAGDLVVFIDDDALPADEEWLSRYVKAFEQEGPQGPGAVGGPVWCGDTSDYEFRGGLTSDYGFQVFDADGSRRPDSRGPQWVPRIAGGNCAFRRPALVDVGGFDAFYAYYLDEADVCVRLMRTGWGIGYVPESAIRHYPERHQRKHTLLDRRWDTVARSDAYFGLKNGADAIPARLIKTIAYAPRKHYVAEILAGVRRRQISIGFGMRMLGRWARGLAAGLACGLLKPRRMVRFDGPPPPFLPFAPPLASRRLRIALLSQTVPGQPGYGGIGRYTFDLARGLHERGHDVHVFCRSETPLRRENLGFFVHGIPPSRCADWQIVTGKPVLNKNLGYGLALLRELGDAYAQGLEFDVVHATNWDAEGLALIRARVYPVVLMLVTPLAQSIREEGWDFNDDLQACVSLDRWQMEHADTVCVPSDGVLSSYDQSMGVRRESLPHLHTVPLGIVPDGAGAAPAAGRHRLLFVGRCERRKGVHRLLEVLPGLLARHPDWECHLVGDDRVPLVEGGTMKERFHGTVGEAELRVQYRQCDLFVAPSLFESFGLIYLEAMQYGKAVIGCRTGGVPEVVEHGRQGLLVAPDDPAELRTALQRLMEDEPLRQRMGQAGIQRVRRVMNYRAMAERMEPVYLDTMARVGEPRRARRKRQWPSRRSANDIECSGDWRARQTASGAVCWQGGPAATIAFAAAGGTRLRLQALRDPRSGILEVKCDGKLLRYVDLYEPERARPSPADAVDIDLPGVPDTPVAISLRVHPERNPRSGASQVSLQFVSAVRPAAYDREQPWSSPMLPSLPLEDVDAGIGVEEVVRHPGVVETHIPE